MRNIVGTVAAIGSIVVSPAAYKRIAAATVASLVFIMVTGAAVRLTGSGLGCPSWPNCEEGSLVPRDASDAAPMIEFGNRLVTGVVMLFTAAAVLGARWRKPYRRDLYRWSWGLPVWVMGNAIVGALVVWLHLSPVSVIAHFLLSLGALWNALVLYAKAGEDDAVERRVLATPAVVRGCNALLLAAGLALVTGTIVTGSGPHAGDSDEAADRLPFDVGEVARIHGITVVLFLGLALLVLWRAGQGDTAGSVQVRLRALVTVIVAQGAVGYVQYFNDVPALLVGIHVLGSACVWLAVLWVRLGLTGPAEGVVEQQPAREWARAAAQPEPHRS